MKENTFYIDNFRAMVSLGALNENVNCSYCCAFCYMQDGFGKYPKVAPLNIVEYLIKNQERFSIVYISGDVDSFAPPRTQKGLELLESISTNLNCDIMFTTRTIFSKIQLQKIEKIADIQNKKGKKLFAAISITRFSEKNKYLEPNPIPSPEDRIKTLIKLKKHGAVTILALRPFLPVVGVDEYLTILDKTKGDADIVLGEPYYFKSTNSPSFKRVFDNKTTHEELSFDLNKLKMQVDTGNSDWYSWSSTEYENSIKLKCSQIGTIFSMHSEDAINEYRKKLITPVKRTSSS